MLTSWRLAPKSDEEYRLLDDPPITYTYLPSEEQHAAEVGVIATDDTVRFEDPE